MLPAGRGQTALFSRLGGDKSTDSPPPSAGVGLRPSRWGCRAAASLEWRSDPAAGRASREARRAAGYSGGRWEPRAEAAAAHAHRPRLRYVGASPSCAEGCRPRGEGARASGARGPGGEREIVRSLGRGPRKRRLRPACGPPWRVVGPAARGRSQTKAARSRLGERLILFVAGGGDGIAGFRDLPRPSEAKELGFKPSAFGILNLKTSLNIVLPATKNWAFVISLCFMTPGQGFGPRGLRRPTISLYLL